MAYSLRQKEKKNYRDLADVKLPPTRKLKSSADADKLYAVEILETDEERGRVKVHYTGYGPEYDEWKREGEIVKPNLPSQPTTIY